MPAQFTPSNTLAWQVLPALDARGTLAFNLAPGYHGVASLSVVATDDGGTLRGGNP